MVFIVLAVSQVWAYAFPQLADDEIQLDFERVVDNNPVEEIMFNYAKLLLEIQHKPKLPGNGMAEDQSNARCPTLDCECNKTMQVLQGYTKDENGNPIQNCTIFNVPYCQGVCESSFRLVQPIVDCSNYDPVWYSIDTRQY